MKEAYLRKVGKEITKIRNENGLTSGDLAKITGIPTSTINRYEAGLGIKLDKLADILKAFKITLPIFFERISAK